ncbi:MAG: DUF1844 domain-containing protein [Deltaproteobacteria bacterium]|nr:DUF1844 domain-containing protein [Deltaproteobacteria bacterium]MBW2400960.1 DUF1844 domain-containing protein [Deltaproteobacteria bacterium]MBW2666473.1 DUF1844 domain-containing protein [Deltaproteobacteria bacterium]
MAQDERDESQRGFTLGESSSPEEAPDAIPKIDFSTFVISLGTSAMYHMGMLNDPEQGEPAEANLVLAQQTIDTLEMLSEKTQGNLGTQEAKLIESLLYELRMQFVECEK